MINIHTLVLFICDALCGHYTRCVVTSTLNPVSESSEQMVPWQRYLLHVYVQKRINRYRISFK